MSAAANRICVTGGAGFIGSHVVHELLKTGREVVVIDDLSVGQRDKVPPGAEFIEGDILDPDVAAAAARCDSVIHLAARVAIRSSFEFIVEDTTTNVVGTASLLRAIGAAEAASVKQFLFASSMAVYAEGAPDRAIDENHAIAPLSPYGVSKYAAEMLVQQVCARNGIDAGILRLFNTYGQGQALSPYVGVVTIFADAINQGRAPTIFGDGDQCRDFVHVEDVAQAFVKALDVRNNGRVYNIGSGQGRSVNEVFAAIADALGFDQAALHESAVAGELRYSIADIGTARERLDYHPLHSFNDAIASVVCQV